MEIGVAQRPAIHERICGDDSTIVRGEDTLIAVADGLGHGPKAAEASQAFCRYVREHASEGLEDIILGASHQIRRTRGAACALLRIDAHEKVLTFAGVGNIELHAMSRKPIHPISMPGIVGKRIQKVQPFECELNPGDLLAMVSDGISSRLDLRPLKDLSVQEIADTLMKTHGKDHDDATCIVIRLAGEPDEPEPPA
jgi:serine/threonine protein phosphatase PrpC